jgi:uncharacterized tellurite resistance protein B-like protein
MLKKLKALFEQETVIQNSEKDINKAVTFILLEVALADQHLQNEEKLAITNYIAQQQLLNKQETEQYLAELIQEHDWLHSIQAHTRLINEQFTLQQKQGLLLQCWHIAMADNELDKYEEHRIRKLSELLYLPHKDFIQTKLKVIQK